MGWARHDAEGAVFGRHDAHRPNGNEERKNQTESKTSHTHKKTGRPQAA